MHDQTCGNHGTQIKKFFNTAISLIITERLKRNLNSLSLLTTFILCCCLVLPAQANELKNKAPHATASFMQLPATRNFIDMLVKNDKFNKQQLTQLLQDAKLQPAVLDSMRKPYEAQPWHIYRQHFLTDKRLHEGVAFWQKHQRTLSQVEKQYGVPANVIVAIIGVESSYGQRHGKYRVLDALATLAFSYPPRAKFFSSELREFLLLTRESHLDAKTIYGSYAGAIGYGQFMPSSYRHYAVDFDHDGKRDLSNNVDDAIASIANYLAKNGWHRDTPIATPASLNGSKVKSLSNKSQKPSVTLATWQKQHGVQPKHHTFPATLPAILVRLDTKTQPEFWLGFHNFYVITRYNTSVLYAMAVTQLSNKLAQGHQSGNHSAERNRH